MQKRFVIYKPGPTPNSAAATEPSPSPDVNPPEQAAVTDPTAHAQTGPAVTDQPASVFPTEVIVAGSTVVVSDGTRSITPQDAHQQADSAQAKKLLTV